MLSAITAEAIVKEFSAGLVSILSLRESNPPISAGLKAASSTAASSPHDALGARVALRGTLDTPKTIRDCTPSGTGGRTRRAKRGAEAPSQRTAARRLPRRGRPPPTPSSGHNQNPVG